MGHIKRIIIEHDGEDNENVALIAASMQRSFACPLTIRKVKQ